MKETKQALEAVVGLVGKATDSPLIMEKFQDNDSLLTFGNTGVLEGDFRYSLWCGIKEPDAQALAAAWNFLRTHGPQLAQALDDARRYRFLRDKCKREWESDMPHNKGAPSLDIEFEAKGHDLDAAIDELTAGEQA